MVSSISRTSVVFVDSRLELDLSTVALGTEIICIDPTEDGIARISQVLATHHNLASVQIIGHGNAGQLFLGNVELSNETLAQYEKQVRGWGSALAEDGDFLLFGCNIAAGDRGKTFIHQIAELTQTDVAASTDLTGNEALGGDWELEYRTGDIEAASTLALETLAEFDGVLLKVSSDSDLVSALSNGITAIELTANITLGQSLPPITKNLTIDGNGYTIDGQNIAQIFVVTNNANVTLQDLTLYRGRAEGKVGQGSNNGGLGAGGAIELKSGTVVADSVFFKENRAIGGNANLMNGGDGKGGAVYVYSGSSLYLINSRFDNKNYVAGGIAGSNGVDGAGRYANLYNDGGTALESGSTYDVYETYNLGALTKPTVSLGSITNPTEDGTNGSIVLNLSSFPGRLTVPFTLGGTATSSDYQLRYNGVALNGSVTIPAYTTSISIDVVPVNDTAYDPNETIQFALNSGSIYNLGTTTSQMLTIADNEPIISIAPSSPTFIEGSSGSFTLTFDKPAPHNFTIPYTVGGTATAGNDNDYAPLTGLISVAQGESSKTITINSIDDKQLEGSETIAVTLGNSSNGAGQDYRIGTGSATLTIADNEIVPTATIAGVNQPIEGSTKAKFRITLSSGALGNDSLGGQRGTFFYYTLTAGTATAVTDFEDKNATTGRVFIAENATSADVEIDITDDLAYEATGETFTVNLANHATTPTLYTLGATISANFTIADNDLIPVATLQRVSDPVEENEAQGQFRVNLASIALQGGVTVGYEVVTATSTATSGVDFAVLSGTVNIAAGQTSADIPVVPIDDRIYDPNETLSVRLKNPTGGALYSVGSSSPQIQFTLTDNDHLYTVKIQPSTSANENGTLGAFLVTLDQAAHANITIDYTISGSSSAISGTDYTPISGSVTVAQGQTTASIQIQAKDNQIAEGDRSLVLAINPQAPAQVIKNDNNYQADASAQTATISIQDNDTPGVRLTALGNTTSEQGTTADIEVRLESQPTAPVTVTLTSSNGGEALMLDGATPNTSASVTFLPSEWQTGKILKVQGVDDGAVQDGNQPYNLVSSVSSTDTRYATLASKSVSLTNLDNDGYDLLVNAANRIAEGGTNTYTIELTQPPTVAIPIEVVADTETQVSSDGVTFASSTIVNLADTSAKTIYVRAIDDTKVEGLHGSTIAHRVLDHTDPNYPKQTALTSAVLTLEDNDSPIVSILKADLASEESLIAGRFAVALDQPAPAGGLTVNYTVTAGNATAGTDYRTLNGTLFIAEGSTGGDITVNPIQDNLQELGGETLTVAISGGTGYTVNASNASKTVTIYDDDQAGVRISQSGNTTRVLEGVAGDSYTIELTSQPTSNVTINLNTSGEVAPDKTSVTFTSANWNVPQTITLPQIDNLVVEGDRTQTITHSVTSSDSSYNGLAIDPVTIQLVDNDKPGIKVSQSSFTTQVTENGATDSYTIVLESAPNPTKPVTIDLTSSENPATKPLTNKPELSFSSNKLVFNATNWNVPQTVTVTAVNDGIDATNRTAAIAHKVTSPDTNYNNYAIVDIPVAIAEDDRAGILIEGTGSQTYVIESSGNPDFINVTFAAQPTADVTIAFNTGNELEPIANRVVTPNNWNQPIGIPVYALRDTTAEPTEVFDLGFTVTSLDPGYNGLTIPAIPVTIEDAKLSGEQVAEGIGSILDEMDGLLEQQLNAIELPLVGSLTEYAPDFIGTFRNFLIAELKAGGQATATQIAEIIQNAIQKAFDNAGIPTEVAVELAVGLEEQTFNITIGNTYELNTDLSADLGIPALGLEVDGKAITSFNYELGLGIGWHSDFGFFVNTETTNIKASVGVDLDEEFKATGNLGLLQIEAANNPNDPTRAGVDLSVELKDLDNTPQIQFLDADSSGAWETGEPLVEQQANGSFPTLPVLGRFDLNSNGQYDAAEGAILTQAAPDDENRLTLAELSRDFTLKQLFDPTLEAGANLGLNLTTSIDGSAAIPRFLFDLNVDWTALSYKNGQFTGPQVPEVAFDNLRVDVGSFVSDFAQPVFGKVNDVIDPLRPVLDFLQRDISFFSTLGVKSLFGKPLDNDGDGKISLVDLASVIPQSKVNVQPFIKAINTIDKVSRLIDQLANTQGNYVVPMGSFDISVPDLSHGFEIPSFDSISSGIKTAVKPISLPSTASLKSALPKVTALPVEQQLTTTTGSTKELFDIIRNDSTLEFPILTDPMAAIDLLLGKEDVSLFTYDLPPLEIGAGFKASFPIWFGPPTISAYFGGNIGVGADLAFGFDTQGFYDWSRADFDPVASYLPLDGFYVSDTENPDGTGEDVDEFYGTLGLTLGLSAGLNLGIASIEAYVEGGLQGYLGIDFRDTGESAGTADGKIRAISEIGANLLQPWQLFNLYGSLTASAEVGIRASFLGIEETLYSIDFGPYTLAEFEYGENGFTISTAFDGPLAGATAFFDANFNNIQDPAEPFTITRQNGRYDLAIPLEVYDSNGNGQIDLSEGQVIVTGGSDTDTYQEQRFDFVSSPQWTVASPLTMLALKLEETDPEAVEAQVERAFGLPAGFNLGKDSPLAGIRAGDSNAAAVFRTQAQLQNLLIFGVNSLSPKVAIAENSANGGANSGNTNANAEQQNKAAVALANQLIGLVRSGATLNLTDAAQMRGIIAAAAAQLGVPPAELDAAIAELSDRNTAIAAQTGTGEAVRAAIADRIAFDRADASYVNILELPWMTLIRGAVAEPDTPAAMRVVQQAFNLPTSEIDRFDPFAEMEKGNVTGLAVYAKQVQINAMLTQLADIIIGLKAEDAETTVVDALVAALKTGQSFANLSDPGTIATLLTQVAPSLSPTLVDGLAAAIAESNAKIDELVAQANGSNLQGLRTQIAREQTIAQGVQSQLLQSVALGEITLDQFKQLLEFNAQFDLGIAIERILEGTDGDDTLVGDDRNEAITAFAGNDLVQTGGGDNIAYGNQGRDTLEGGVGSDVLSGGRDDDAIVTGNGNNYAFGNKGSDRIVGGDDLDNLYGGQDNDFILGQAGDDWLLGEKGDDIADGGDGNDILVGGEGLDSLQGGGGDDLIFGNIGADSIDGGSGNDSISAGKEDDLVWSNAGDDVLFGNMGSDFLDAGDGNDTILGGQDDDRAFGNLGDDVLYGNLGNDLLEGGDGNDTVSGGQESDRVFGNAGNDALLGNIGTDVLDGGDGNDYLGGGQNNDTLIGGIGDDTLSGDLGDDSLTGGGGSDRFAFSNGGNDIIADFTDGSDRIVLSADLLAEIQQRSVIAVNTAQGARIELGGGSITLQGVNAAAIDRTDFIRFD